MSALIEHFNNSTRANHRELQNALNVHYYKRLVQGQWVGTSATTSSATVTYTQMHEYHRVARKRYRYVGMTYAAAFECASAMKTLYTRTVKYQEWSSTQGTMGDWIDLSATSTEMSAEIVPSHVGGEMWEVTVSVNEDSIYMAKTSSPKYYNVIFASERQRDYDGETEAV